MVIRKHSNLLNMKNKTSNFEVITICREQKWLNQTFHFAKIDVEANLSFQIVKTIKQLLYYYNFVNKEQPNHPTFWTFLRKPIQSPRISTQSDYTSLMLFFFIKQKLIIC